MIDHRVTEMDKQFGDTQYRFDDPQERVTVLPRRIFGEYASVHFPGSETLYLGLTALGVIGLTWQTWRWLSAGHSNGAGPVIATFTALLAGPSLLTPLDWERYYLFPVAFDILCVAVAVGWLAGLAPRAASATLNGARGLMRRKGDAPLR